MFDLTVDTLRYYERIGIIPLVARNKSGYREYTTRDLNLFCKKFAQSRTFY